MSDTPNDSIAAVGFLSPHLGSFVDRHRSEHLRWFEFAEQINRSGQGLACRIQFKPVPGLDEAKVLVLLLLMRLLSNFQGAILLTERGMIVEARTISRMALETAFLMCALQKEGKPFVDDMLRDEFASRKSLAKWFLKDPSRLAEVAEDPVRELNQFLRGLDDRWSKLTLHDIQRVAERGGVGEMYLYYRLVSADAAHPSMTALSRYALMDEEEGALKEVNWGPEIAAEHISETLNITCQPMIAGCSAAAELFGDNVALAELATLTEQYVLMND